MKENKIAKILKVYAYINGAVGIIASCIMGGPLSDILGDEIGILSIAFGIATAIAVNFLIYAFGEHLQLLQDIKNNTGNGIINDRPQEDEIPEI